MWKLVIEDDEGKRTVVPLTRDDYTIGRQEGNTIRLTERNVSREHGRIRRRRPNGANGASPRERDLFVLEDRQSYNGLFVNGLRVAHTQDLQHGDLIQIGDYRIVLQDDAASAVETAAIPVTTTEIPDAKATIPMAHAFRGQDLTERPSRFVMLVGPTPGVEYPLDRERMTIGRAEDSSISINHNSVSRLHCEVHALGDGRYEIVDKGSSNGVRVNAVELKRSIIEAGDVIELGDVRFKFVGAGQVFVPGPNESQQLTAISDREAELVDPNRRSWGGYALPILGAGFVGALIILGFVWFLRARAGDNGSNGNITQPADNDQQAVTETRKTCTTDDCESYYHLAEKLAAGSPWRETPEFRQVEGTWVEYTIKKSRAQADGTTRRSILLRAAGTPLIADGSKKRLDEEIATLDQPAATPSQLPIATAATVAPTTTPSPPVTTAAPTATPKAPPTHATAASATPPGTTAPPATTTSKPSQGSNFDRASQAALNGRYGEVKTLLQPAARAGRATPDEVRLLLQACKQLHDQQCQDELKPR
ncbi:MAG: FHA domain-containing protein [Deltaproteobacteria bacterium]|nr:FHA domain-containing protein [Deltaproteobacteria bacterium]